MTCDHSQSKEHDPRPRQAAALERAGANPEQPHTSLRQQVRELERQLQEEKKRRRKSEMLLAAAQAVAHLGSWEWNLETDQFTWTEELFRIYGRSPEQFTPGLAEFLGHVHPEDRPEVERALAQARDSGNSFDLHHRIVRADGIVRTLHSHGQFVQGKDGERARILGTGRDVTETRQTEATLRQREKQYRMLARHVPDAAVILYDSDLRITLVEGTISPYRDLNTLETEGRRLADLLPPVEVAANEEKDLVPYREALEGKPQIFERQLADKTLQIHALSIRDDDAQISGGMIMLQDITRQKKAQARLEKTAQQLTALSQMGQTVAASLDLEIVFSRVVEALRSLLKAQGVAILLREGKDRLRFAAGSQESRVGFGGLQGTRVSSDQGIAGIVLRTGESQWRSSPEPLDEIYPEIRASAYYKPRAILAVPLSLQGEMIGVMEAVHARPDAFQEDDLTTLEAAANWTAIAIGNARQHERLQRRLRESEAMATISRSLSETLEMEQLLNRIVDSTRQLLPQVEWATIHLLEGKGRQLFPAAVSGLDIDGDYPAGAPAPVDWDAPTGDTLAPGEWPGATRTETGKGSLLVVPLETRQGRSGILSVQRSGPRAFTDHDEALLRSLGLQAAMAIDNARLFSEQQQARQKAEILRSANVALSNSLNLNKVLNTLLDYMRQLLGYERANVLLLDEGGDSFNSRAWRGYSEKEIAVKEKDMFTYANVRQVLETGQSAVIEDISQQRDWVHLPGRDEERSSWLGIPLLRGDKIIGILSLIKPGAGAYGEEQVLLGEALAAQAASAVQNARLFTEVESGRERLRYLTKQIVSAQEKERQRISRELHDEAGQALTALKISLEMMKGRWPELPVEATEQLEESALLIDQTMDQIRLLAHNLRPPVLDTLGLVPAIEGLCRDFSRRTQLPISFDAHELPAQPETITISVYRFVQETLTNVAKHAQATEIRVELRSDDDMIRISVSDNGRGFDAKEHTRSPERRGGIGLSGMQDRFELLNGWVTVDSSPGRGTRVVAYVPCEEDP